MLLLVTNMERQALDVHNKTFEPVEVTLFQNAYSGIAASPTIYKTCEKRVFIFQNLPYYYEVIYERANSERFCGLNWY
jgi:hypothetical protein